MMRPLVLKFGGTSVASAPAIRRAAAIVARAAHAAPVAVVVSAMSRVTDGLLEACSLAQNADAAAASSAIASIRARHLDAVSQLGLGADAEGALKGQIEDHCTELTAVLASVAVLRELTPRAQDRVVATGELLSSRMFAATLEADGLPSRWIDARHVIVTDASHGAALPRAPHTSAGIEARVQPVIRDGGIPVLGGFTGATEDGITTTLGRGGSDYSAAILGAGLDAAEIQIWTDVDGMLTADPRLVPDAQVVPRLSFGEASELAYFGAKVLHPSTILPAVERNIPVRILNTMRPDGSGSLITNEPRTDERPLTAVACKRRVTVVDVTSTRMLMAHGFLRRLFEVFERHRTSVDVVTTSEVSVSMTLDDDGRIEEIERDLREFASVQVERGLAIVSAVSDRLCAAPALASRIVGALEPWPVRMVSQAASRRNVTVVLRDEDLPAAMNRLHDEFFLAPAHVAEAADSVTTIGQEAAR